MANLSLEEMHLQLAVAFGQGTGTITVSPAALAFALKESAGLIERAREDWRASRYAFTDLVRRMGQISATLAIVDGKAEIAEEHVKRGLDTVANVCPCKG
ncbi:MAG TPA: hypothetical protein VMX54_11720 [Vicinamibacteria bacterium]|nr:hypothetical protein [Vicinamibacteria bacterium]